MIFKSSSLVTNILLGVLLLQHRYSLAKYLAVILVTGGLIACTLEDYRLRMSNLAESINPTEWNATTVALKVTDSYNLSQALGIVFLAISLLFSSGIGIYQEYLVRVYGKHPDECLLYVHLLSLPLFMLVAYSDLIYHWHLFTDILFHFWSPHLSDYLPLIYLLFTVASQYGCIRCVFLLATECTSLTVTLVVTNRKFLSLLFSIWYFGNLFTWKHYAGSAMVFFGTLAISLN